MHHVIGEQRKYSEVFPYQFTFRGGPSLAPLLGEMSDRWQAFIDAALLAAKVVGNRIFGIQLTDYGEGSSLTTPRIELHDVELKLI